MSNFLELIIYIFLGALQGISEILPISSSGHLALFQIVLNVNTDNEALFAIFLHFASLIALLIYFRTTIWKILKSFYYFIIKSDKNYKEDFMLFIYLIIASVPVGLGGLIYKEKIDSIFSNLLFIGIAFIFNAFILALISNLKEHGEEKITFKKALIIGFFQLIGIIPGISRSGITITGGKIAKLNNEKTKNFAFLLFIPVALGSFIFSLDDLYLLSHTDNWTLILYIISMIVSGIFTYLALVFIFKKIHIEHFKYFAAYMVIIGLFTLTYYVIFIK